MLNQNNCLAETARGIQLTFRQQPHYLLVEGGGQWTIRNASQAIEAVAAEAHNRNLKLLLIDLLGISKPDSEMTRYYSGMHFPGSWDFPSNRHV